MKFRSVRPLLILALSGIALAIPQSAVSAPSLPNRVLNRALDIELGRVQRGAHEQAVSSGVMYALLQGTGVLDQRTAAASGSAPLPLPPPPGTQGCPNVFSGTPANIRVNQDCSLRRQAEEVVVANPNNSNNLIAGQNDSRIGFNHCGYDWSFDRGQTWGDQLPPFFQFILLDGHTADACSDPTATFDANGNAYVGGVLFDINSAASAFVVEKSNAPIGGAFYHTPRAGTFQEYLDNPPGVVANDNDPNIFNDKEFIVADNHSGSLKANNVYATWTRFAATSAGVGSNSPIFFSQSTNGGATWSPGIEISGANKAACTAFSGEANAAACDQDQGSDPIVGTDGTLYVAFGNGNTPVQGVNQHMIVSCPATANCSSASSWSAPVKISDDFGTQPIGPDATTGCPAGRMCLPPNGYRLDDFVEGSLSVDNANNLYFAWADFRNGHAPCKPLQKATIAKPPCDNDVFYAFSTNRGSTWSATVNLTPAALIGASAQWQPWSAVSPDGSSLWVAYYDRHYPAAGTNTTCEFTGCNDITLAQVSSPTATGPTVTYTRVTTGSMPNLVPANNPAQAGFLGDYMWLSVDGSGNPLIVWADTRGRGQSGVVEEDVYFAKPKG